MKSLLTLQLGLKPKYRPSDIRHLHLIEGHIEIFFGPALTLPTAETTLKSAETVDLV